MRNYILTLLTACIFMQYSCSQTSSETALYLNSEIKRIKADKELKNAGIGFYAVDMSTGETIGQINKELALSPASTQKLITCATALDVLGANYRFTTKLEYSGRIDTIEKILHGDIMIRGGGDPTLGSKYFKKSSPSQFLHIWADAVKKAGIEKITGRVIADARIYGYDIVPPTWSWEDMGNYFGAGACGLTVYDNFYTLYYKTSSKIGGKTKILKIEPQIPGLIIQNNVTSDNIRSDLSYIFGAPYTYLRYINGRLPRGRSEYKVKGSLPDPAYFTALELEKILKLYNIKTDKPATTFRMDFEATKKDTIKCKLLHTTYSPKLKDIAEKTNFRSVNLYAEHLLNHIGFKKKGEGRTKPASDYIESFWAARGMNTGGLSVNDGSGLSRYNTVTAKQLVFILKYMKTKSKNTDVFCESIPLVGKEGTVKYMCKGTSAQNNMRAKSGSIRNVRAYAGYVKSKSGREIAFAIMLNNFNCSSSKARKKIEKILVALADYNK